MNKTNFSKLKFLTVLALTLTVASVAFAAAYFYQAPGNVGGKPPNQIGALWEKWALKNPKPTNVLLDTTGAFCGQNQPPYSGNPATNIWWLAGTNGGGTVTRTCTVPLTRTLVFPIVTNAYFGFSTDTQAEIDQGVADAVATANAATGLSVTFDGAPLSNPKLYLTKSAPFSVTLPANNIYELPAGTVLSPSTDVGYYVGVTLYTPGSHTLKFKGTIAGESIDVTYKLNVKYTPF
jgi:hypothetical protein